MIQNVNEAKSICPLLNVSVCPIAVYFGILKSRNKKRQTYWSSAILKLFLLYLF